MPRNTILLYRCLQLLNFRYNDALAERMSVVTQVFLIVLPAGRIYTILTFYAQIGPAACIGLGVMTFMNFVVVLSGYPNAAAINSRSIAFINQFKRRPDLDPSVNPCEVRSCKPLKVELGTLLHIRKFTVLKVLHLILNWTMRSMIIFRVKQKI